MSETPHLQPVEDAPQGFTFSYKAFENLGVFVQAVQKVYTCKAYPNFKTTHRIKRLGDAIQKELNTYQEFRREVDVMEDGEEKAKKLIDLHNTEVKLKWNPLSEAELNCVPGLSPADLIGIEFISEPSIFA